MAQIKIKQISGLQTALNTKVQTASNQGGGAGTLFKQKTGTDLEFNSLASGLGVAVNSPSSSLITFDLDLGLVTDTTTSIEDADLVAIVDTSDSNATKLITRANLLAGLTGGAIEVGDYTAESATQSTDQIVFFDASDADGAKRQTKAQFLADYATISSPTFTGTPAGPTPSAGTNTTQLATTAFVKTEIDNALAGLDFQADVLASQTDATLNPGATPTTGDRYIIENSGALHANFGTITGIGDDDIVEYDGDDFIVVWNASDQGEGALAWDRNADTFRLFDGTAWGDYGGLAGITAGGGLTKTGNTLDVVGTADRITVNANDIDIASTYVGQTSIVTVGTITTGTWSGTTIAFNKGGTGLTTLTANTVLASDDTANELAPVALTTNTLLGRASGNIAALSGSNVRTIANVRKVVDKGTLTASSMTLGTLSQTPQSATLVQVFINGILLRETTDYTVSGTTVTATSALNTTYGGSGSDGAGFESTDLFQAVYEY